MTKTLILNANTDIERVAKNLFNKEEEGKNIDVEITFLKKQLKAEMEKYGVSRVQGKCDQGEFTLSLTKKGNLKKTLEKS